MPYRYGFINIDENNIEVAQPDSELEEWVIDVLRAEGTEFVSDSRVARKAPQSSTWCIPPIRPSRDGDQRHMQGGDHIAVDERRLCVD